MSSSNFAKSGEFLFPSGTLDLLTEFCDGKAAPDGADCQDVASLRRKADADWADGDFGRSCVAVAMTSSSSSILDVTRNFIDCYFHLPVLD